MLIESAPGVPRPGVVTAGQRRDEMRRRNESTVLRTVLGLGSVSRAQIARLTGLSSPAVTTVTGRLIAAGILRELKSTGPRDIGRPPLPVSIDPERAVAVGVHIASGGTGIGLIAVDGSIRASIELAHHTSAPAEVCAQAVEGIQRLVSEHAGGATVLGTAFSLGGWVDDQTGVVVEHEALGWRSVPLLELIGDRVPGPVVLDQHTRSLARAELWFGVGREVDDFVLLFAGSITDAAVVTGRRVHPGPGSAAGNIAHLQVGGTDLPSCSCGNVGCLQATVGEKAVLARAAAWGLGNIDRLNALIALAASGDTTARRLMRERHDRIGRAAAILFDVVNPPLLVLAGSDLAAPESVDDIRETVARQVHRDTDAASRVVPTRLGEKALVLASAAPLLERVIADPFAYLSVRGAGTSAARINIA